MVFVPIRPPATSSPLHACGHSHPTPHTKTLSVLHCAHTRTHVQTQTHANERPSRAQADKRFVEGFAHSEGLDAKAIDPEKGKRIMVEAKLRGSPIAKAECHYQGWDGLIMGWFSSRIDWKGAFDQFSVIAAAAESGAGREGKKSEGGGRALAHVYFRLGSCHEEGHAVPKNMGKAREWYAKAVKQGHAIARRKLNLDW